MAGAASRLTHLTNKMFLRHFDLTFPQRNPWCLLTLPSGLRQRLTYILHIKRCHMDYLPHSSKKTPPPGANGGTSAAVCKPPLTSKIFKTPLLSSIFSLIASVPAFCLRKGNLSRINMLSNTSAGLVKSLHPWGPTTPVTTAWGSSTFGWDASWRPIRRKIILQQEYGPSLLDSSKPWTPLSR